MNDHEERLARPASRPDTDQPDRAPFMWRRLDASLVYDSRERGGLAGVRGGTAGQTRLMYTARDLEIDIRIRPGTAHGGLRLLGQVLDEEFEPATGRIVVDGPAGTVTAELDNCGHFSIGGVTPGTLRMEAHLPTALVVIPLLRT